METNNWKLVEFDTEGEMRAAVSEDPHSAHCIGGEREAGNRFFALFFDIENFHWAKGILLEGAMRAPIICNWPGKAFIIAVLDRSIHALATKDGQELFRTRIDYGILDASFIILTNRLLVIHEAGAAILNEDGSILRELECEPVWNYKIYPDHVELQTEGGGGPNILRFF